MSHTTMISSFGKQPCLAMAAPYMFVSLLCIMSYELA